jgi:hypothetical protein
LSLNLCELKENILLESSGGKGSTVQSQFPAFDQLPELLCHQKPVVSVVCAEGGLEGGNLAVHDLVGEPVRKSRAVKLDLERMEKNAASRHRYMSAFQN